MIAMLGMYDMPALQSANDRFWEAIRDALGYGPTHLDRAIDVWDAWQSPDLVLAQTCGYPYRARLHGLVQLIGTPDYGLPGCPAGYYRSEIVVRVDDPRDTISAFDGARFAYNEPLSQSGWAAPMVHIGAQARFSELHQTGSHADSMRAVANGQADLAGIDSLTWALLQEQGNAPPALRVLESTAPTPGLPYITAEDHNAAEITKAVRTAIDRLSSADRDALHLKALVEIPPDDYLAIPTPPAPVR